MKTIAFSIILVLSLIACKKDNHKIAPPKAVQDSLQVNKTEEIEVILILVRKWKPDDISLQLKSKANDTLYITKFFATWCSHCKDEMPYISAKMTELSTQPVKFTFISLDDKEEWNNKVWNFASKYDLRNNVFVVEKELLKPNFFTNNFKTWTGKEIPFTIMKKGNHTEEYLGAMTKEVLNSKITKMLSVNKSTKVDEQKEKNKIAASMKEAF